MPAHPFAQALFERYNENHDPDTGEFSSGDGGGSGGSVQPTEPISAPNASKPKPEAAHEPHTGYEFVSPSVASHLDFSQAVDAISGDQQRELREASLYINGAMHVNAREYDIVGAWADGAENSVLDVVEGADWDSMKLAASMKGWLADQKQVLIFQEEPGGEAAMAHFEATGKLEDIHQNLLQDGVAFHTLVPHEGGATVYVADLDGSAADAIEKAAERYDAEVGIKWGRAEFLGTQKQDGTDREQRDDARHLYEENIRQSQVAGHDQVWQRVRDRWGEGLHQGQVDGGSRAAVFVSGPAAARAHALYFSRYNENHDPDNGEFTTGDGGGGSGGSVQPTEAISAPAPAAETVDHSPKAEPVLNPDAVNVSGDDWNKETARRLETEFQSAKPDLDQLVRDGIGDNVETDDEDHNDEDQPSVPEEWDMLSGDQQEQAKDAYVKQNLDSYIDSEQSYYFESGNALDDAKRVTADKFNDGDAEWADDAIQDVLDAREENGKPIPYTLQQLKDAISVEYKDGYEGNGDFTVEFDDDKLQHPSTLIEGQALLPGIEPIAASAALSVEMRDALEKTIKDAFEEEAEDAKDKLDAPDYIADSAQEQVEEDWEHNYDDDDKFKWTKNNTDIIEDAQTEADAWAEEHSSSASGEVPDPNSFKPDPLQQSGSKGDYAATQRLASYLSLQRQMQLIEQRGIKNTVQNGVERDPERANVERIDKQLWGAWKDSSTSFGGQILQLATADELGGRYRDLPTHKSDLIAQANDRYKQIGGYAGIKTLVRAKWETSQYILEKAGINRVEVYRGMKVDLPKDAPVEAVTPRFEINGKMTEGAPRYRLTDFKTMRNGAWSTTTESGVANGWNLGSGTKIVLRIDAPRTAVISFPAYGINVHSEKEVVLAGTSYKHWDAWRGDAPTFADVPIGAPAQAEKKEAA